MSELRDLLRAWDCARANGEEVVLATVVRVQGSSYRKPGARMLLSGCGKRIGMISGGCLETEIIRKARWLTENGPTVQRYGTFVDDDPEPQQLGCGGIVDILLERGETARVVLEAIRPPIEAQRDVAMLTVLESEQPEIGCATRLAIRNRSEIVHSDIALVRKPAILEELMNIATNVLVIRQSTHASVTVDGFQLTIFAEYLAPPPALFIFGAGDDALPLVDLAYMLGWRVTIADARPHLATKGRFPKADEVVVLKYDLHRGASGRPEMLDLSRIGLDTNAIAVVLTHNYMQDRHLLSALLPLPLRYLGILGPRFRTLRLVTEIASETGVNPEMYLDRLHGPVGLRLGAETSAEIALSIIAEIQSELRTGSGRHRAENIATVPESQEMSRRVYA